MTLKRVLVLGVLSLFSLAIVGFMASVVSQPDERPPVPIAPRPHGDASLPRRYASFEVNPLTITESSAVSHEWVDSRTVLPDRKVTLIVAASWCPFSKRALEKLENTHLIDAVLLYEDEVSKAIDRELRKGNIDREKAASLRAKYRGKPLLEPDKLAGLKYKFFQIRSAQFDSLVDGYPTFIECDPHGCRKALKD